MGVFPVTIALPLCCPKPYLAVAALRWVVCLVPDTSTATAFQSTDDTEAMLSGTEVVLSLVSPNHGNVCFGFWLASEPGQGGASTFRERSPGRASCSSLVGL